MRRRTGDKALAWRLAGRGLRQLRDLQSDPLQWYRPVQLFFLEHLLDTNAVWAKLAGPEPVWADLPFTWIGSHRARFDFVVSGRGGHRRARYIHPDAIIESRRGPRVFLELDRGTDCFSERAGRRSIAGKLQAYRAALALPSPGERCSAYALAFTDGRPPRVLFVALNDHKGRRARGIVTAAREVAAELDVASVQVQDTAGLRSFVLELHQKPTREAVPRRARAARGGPGDPGGDGADVLRLAVSFYRAAVLELRAAGVSARSFSELAELQREARQRLESPPRDVSRLINGNFRRFFRASLDLLEKRRPREKWSRELLDAEREIKPLIFPSLRRHPRHEEVEQWARHIR